MLHWDRYEHMVESSLRHSMGTLTLDTMKKGVEEGVYTAFGTECGEEIRLIVLARIVDYDTFRVGHIGAMAGKGLKEASEYLHVLEEWAFSQGAVELHGWCRPAIGRLLLRYGWRHKFSVMSFDLRRRLQ